ncbi:DegT/DnrJ/EryC1/StrS family aminotransferase [Paenibacillus albicereus]|uniref:DegT/DnrJ/EryC1/StrS family aminotransferase n=2 Tax=Paenibacillus albicereus TaxID=2726185 RepID=A0A6H2H3L5_9BACL|nr:DegT/DnrJ/EryC1/StrS family aminotransferase [Paenibacillus albicereus]
MNVPFFNYSARFAPDKDVIKELVYRSGTTDQFILKEDVRRLEEAICAYTGAAHAVAAANGTSALVLLLRTMGAGPGVDVLTPAFSFISTASAIRLLGANPVFVDADPRTGMMDPADLERRITPQSRIVIPTHLFSVMADMKAIRAVAREHGLLVLEDSAVALGASQDGVPAGRHGDAGLYSFFPAKPLGGIGDGAVIVTDDEELARGCRMLRNHGQDGVTRFLHHQLGYNSRMDEVLAGYLLHKLGRIDRLLDRRRDLAARYHEAFAGLDVRLAVTVDDHESRMYYTYVVQAERRDELRAELEEAGVETQVYYPAALPLQPAFADLGARPGDYPGAERFASRSLALPLYPEMPDGDVDEVIRAVVSFLAKEPQHA